MNMYVAPTRKLPTSRRPERTRRRVMEMYIQQPDISVKYFKSKLYGEEIKVKINWINLDLYSLMCC
jgi:hypothetical protein